MLRKIVEASILTAALAIVTSIYMSNFTFAQSEQNFTAPKFGISMQYPSDWTFIPEEEDYTAEGSAVIGDFCPTSAVGDNPKVLDCHMNTELNVPAYLGVTIFKLKNGTTVDEFYDQKQEQFGAADKLTGRKNIDTNKIEISGLPAIQRIDKIGGGSMDKVLESMGQGRATAKVIDAYVVSGDLGYRFFAHTNDQDDFETYSPIFQKMIDSIQIQGTE
jgi:hypothetical protein